MNVPKENLKKSSVFAQLKNEVFQETLYTQLESTPTATKTHLKDTINRTRAQVTTTEGKETVGSNIARIKTKHVGVM